MAFLSRLLPLLVFLPGLASAQTVTVDGPAAFAEALQGAPEGAEIALLPGDYGALSIQGDIAAAVIRSADPDNPARFTSALVEEVDGLTFEGLLFDYVYAPGDTIRDRNFVWRYVTDTTLRGNIFDGDRPQGLGPIDDGYGFAFGLSVWGGENVVIEENEIFDFWKGLHVRGVRHLEVRGNDVHTIRMDGMNFVQVAHVLIEGNHIHDFNRSLDSADHADMIQFWTNRTEWSSHDIVIRGNLLNAGHGWFTQSIFMRNERSDTQGSVDPSIYYRDIVIEENVIINAHTHGITVGDAIGVTVQRNTIVQNPEATPGDPASRRYTPSIRMAEVSRGVLVTDNIVSRVVGYDGQAGWRVSGNLEVQNQSTLGPGYYGLVFQGGAPERVDSFRYRPDGPAARAGLGAAMLR